jgi:hypothetical protein
VVEVKVLLLYGSELPPYKHIEKIMWQYSRHYFRDKLNEDFNEDSYYDVRVEEQYTGLNYRESHPSPVVPVKKEFLPKFIAIFNALKGNVCLCQDKHSHPQATVSGKSFEGMCYYLDNIDDKVFFLAEYRDNNNQYFSIEEWDAYAKLPPDKRWIFAQASKDTNDVFEEWIIDILHSVK